MSFQISLCHHHSNGNGGFLTVPVCQKIKSYEKILSELQNTCENEKGNKKQQLSLQSRVKRLIASRKLNLIKIDKVCVIFSKKICLKYIFSNFHRILFGCFSSQVAEPLRIHAIIVLLHYVCPINYFIQQSNLSINKLCLVKMAQSKSLWHG